MFKSWTLANFKSVYAPTTLELAPLTIFTGTNSSGKSTILQSMLLIAQTLRSPLANPALVLNGPLVKLGLANDIMSAGNDSDLIEIGFEMARNEPWLEGQLDNELHYWLNYMDEEDLPRFFSSLTCKLSFSPRATSTDSTLPQVQPPLQEAAYHVEVDTPVLRDPTALVYDQSDYIFVKETESFVFRRRRRTELDAISPSILDDYPLHDPGRDIIVHILTDSSSLEFKPSGSSSEDHSPSDLYPSATAGVSVDHFLPTTVYRFHDPILEHSWGVAHAPFLAAFPEDHPLLARLDKYGLGMDYTLPEAVIEIVTGALRDMLAAPTGDRTVPIHAHTIEVDPHKTFRTLLRRLHPHPLPDPDREFASWVLFFFLTLSTDKSLSLRDSMSRFASLAPAEQDELRNRLVARIPDIEAALREGSPSGSKVEQAAPSPGLQEALGELRSLWVERLAYLGPLRDDPKAVYPIPSSADTRDVGLKGEFTASVLRVHHDTPVPYIPAEQFLSGTAFSESPTEGAFGPLIDAVRDWLQYMGVAADVEATERGSLGYELKVSDSASAPFHDLTHVGVGVSQVLPILVRALLAHDPGPLLFEQPELHLHPRVQSRLADFFFSMTLLGKQCIVETHSEYIINRLRYLAALPWGDRVSQDTLVYFVEKENGQSRFRPIRINRFGVIEEWPRGFFDESEEISAAILRAVMQKRKGGAAQTDA